MLLFPKKIITWFKITRFRNKIFFLVGVFVVGGMLWYFFGRTSQGYLTAPVRQGEIVEVVSETGSLNSSGRVDVYSPATGIVTDVYVNNNSEVEVDQDLFKVKSTATQQEKSAAWAAYLTAKNTLDSANATAHSLQSTMFDEWNTFKRLAENDTYETSNNTPKYENRTSAEFHIAEKDWLAAEAKYKNQQSVIAQAQAAVSSTWLLYQATQDVVVKSTMAGQVANLAVIPGSLVVAKTTTSVKPVLTIAAPSKIEVVVPLSETDIVKVKQGQDATVEVNAALAKKYKGIVKRVDTIGTTDNGVIRYQVYVEILSSEVSLLTGMTADVEIITNKESNALLVPNTAVKPYQGGRAVRVIGKNGKVEYVPVTVGIRGRVNTQILKGLSEGQLVITSLLNEQIQRPGLFGN